MSCDQEAEKAVARATDDGDEGEDDAEEGFGADSLRENLALESRCLVQPGEVGTACAVVNGVVFREVRVIEKLRRQGRITGTPREYKITRGRFRHRGVHDATHVRDVPGHHLARWISKTYFIN